MLFRSKPGTRKPRTDTVNTNVVGINGRTFAIVEAGGFPVELTDELETISHYPFDNTLDNGFSAHPHIDPKTGDAHAIVYDAPVMDRIWHVVVGSDGLVKRQEPIEVEHGPSVHDCQITENYVLVFDLPATFSMKRMLAGFAFPYDWNPDHKARVGLCPKDGSGADTIWCDVDPCYVYHAANAYESDDGAVIVDVVVHESTYARSTFGPGGAWSRLERWTVDPKSGKVDRKILSDQAQEFPRYDERRTMQDYQYIYAIALAGEPDQLDMAGNELFKHDLKSGEKLSRHFGDKRHPGEFVFVPRSADSAEDEGWLIGLVIDMEQETTELQVLNADDFLGEAQAIIHLPHRIPPGFHGNWVASSCDRLFTVEFRSLQIALEPTAPLFQQWPHLTEGAGRVGERNIGIEMVDQMILHPHRRNIANLALEEPGVAVATQFLGRVMRRPTEEKLDIEIGRAHV